MTPGEGLDVRVAPVLPRGSREGSAPAPGGKSAEGRGAHKTVHRQPLEKDVLRAGVLERNRPPLQSDHQILNTVLL